MKHLMERKEFLESEIQEKYEDTELSSPVNEMEGGDVKKPCKVKKFEEFIGAYSTLYLIKRPTGENLHQWVFS